MITGGDKPSKISLVDFGASSFLPIDFQIVGGAISFEILILAT
jgi:hypothetical protein